MTSEQGNQRNIMTQSVTCKSSCTHSDEQQYNKTPEKVGCGEKIT